jgi:tRNA 2-thiouridine synthesizing protein E
MNPSIPISSAVPRPGPPLEFLAPGTAWGRELAQTMAAAEGLGPLDERHWRLIGFLRGHYRRLGAMPPMRRVCRATGLSREQVKQLFGGCLSLWRVAGLPDPGEEARAYLD